MFQHGNVAERSKVQRVFQIGALKKMLQEKMGDGKVTAKVLKANFDKHLIIKSGEAATEHFLTTALALWNALFSVPRLKETWLNNFIVGFCWFCPTTTASSVAICGFVFTCTSGRMMLSQFAKPTPLRTWPF